MAAGAGMVAASSAAILEDVLTIYLPVGDSWFSGPRKRGAKVAVGFGENGSRSISRQATGRHDSRQFDAPIHGGKRSGRGIRVAPGDIAHRPERPPPEFVVIRDRIDRRPVMDMAEMDRHRGRTSKSFQQNKPEAATQQRLASL